jgi:hypothetical protein
MHAASKADHGRQRRGPLCVRLPFSIPQRAQQQQWSGSDLPSEKLEQAERAEVSPVQIVDDDEQGLRERRTTHCGGHTLEQVEASTGGSLLWRRRIVRS